MISRVQSFRRLVATLAIAVTIALLVIPGSARDFTDTPSVNAQAAGICDRTLAVQNRILRLLADIDNCQLVTEADLATITGFFVVTRTSGIAAGDFDGLINVERLTFSYGEITPALPPGVFDGMQSLTGLTLNSVEGEKTIQSGFLDGLPALDSVDIRSSPIRTIETGAFNNLPRLTEINLSGNEIETIEREAFNGVPQLTSLFLLQNNLASLPIGLFEEMENLQVLNLSTNKFALFPDRFFADMPNLEKVNVRFNEIVRLPANLFEGSINLRIIELNSNRIIELPSTVFDRLSNLEELFLQSNHITELPEGVFKSLRSLQTINIRCNPVASTLTEADVRDRVPGSSLTEVIIDPPPGGCRDVPDPFIVPLPGSTSRILRIEPLIIAVTASPGDLVRLGVDFYGRQNLVENDLADGVALNWQDGRAGGTFSGDGRQVVYSPPENPGSHTVIARLPSSKCFGDAEQCRATFEVTVKQRAAIETTTTASVNPPGAIPQTLTDTDGVAHAVFTPVDGGSFLGDGYSITTGSGAVANGEFVGISMRPTGEASNEGITWHRYTLGGLIYSIGVVDASGAAVPDYSLGSTATACVPLPAELRSNITDLVLVATDGEGASTVLSTRVRLTADGPVVCGELSSLPANIAVGKEGSPKELPIVEPEIEEELPETGGAALSAWLPMLLLLAGAMVVAAGWTATSKLANRRVTESFEIKDCPVVGSGATPLGKRARNEIP